MKQKDIKKKIGIYRELAIIILFSAAVSAIMAIGIFYICRNYKILIQVEEDYSQYNKKCDLQVVQWVRELDSALNTAMEEIESTKTQDENITDAMRYLLENNKMPFSSMQDSDNMSVTIANRKGKVLWKNSESIDFTPGKGEYADIDLLVAESYDEECTEYIFVYTKSVDKMLYYIVFQTTSMPEYIYHDTQLKAACIIFAAALFLFVVLLSVKGRISYIRYLSTVVNEISKGNLNTPIRKSGCDELTIIAESIDEMQYNLNKMMEDERENERRNRELITNLSHDIKTPMTIITGYLDVVISKKYADEAEKDLYLKKAFAQVEKINGMIQKIFLLAKNQIKVEQGNIVRCNIAMMIRQDISEFEGIAQKQNRKIITDIPESPLYADIIIEDMREVLENIFMNAVKYSKPDTDIEVKVTDKENNVCIMVKNKSDEIKKEDCEHIFDKFYRADRARGSDVAGNGLGLSIVRKTIISFKGKVWAEYTDGDFTIYICLPKS